MNEERFLSKPDNESKARMFAAGGRTLKMVINAFTGGVGGDALEIGYKYARDLVKDSRRKRTEELNERMNAASSEVSTALESEEKFEPLMPVFLSVFRNCLEDDEDDKVPYYAALMAGLSICDLEKLGRHRKFAILNAVSRMRAHDFLVFRHMVHLEKANSTFDMTLEDMESHTVSPVHRSIEWELVPQSLTTLKGLGLVEDDSSGNASVVQVPTNYRVDQFGHTLWDLLGPHL